MRHCLYLPLAGVLALCLSCAAPPRRPAEPIELFNGKNLQGWTCFLDDPNVGMKDVWRVEDGILICKGEPLGYLVTESEWTSFRVIVEWRWAPGTTPGNSGVLFRITGEPRPIPRCIEAQLKSGDAGDLYGFHGVKISGDPARMVSQANHPLVGDMVGVKKIKGNENEPGQWNTYEILVDGPVVIATINGVEVNRAADCDVMAGPIGLQSEGGEIHFRTVRLLPLE